jgi:hypothetical protein
VFIAFVVLAILYVLKVTGKKREKKEAFEKEEDEGKELSSLKEEEGEDKQSNKEDEDVTESKEPETPSTTSVSMNFLVESFETMPPFNKAIVDVRDSLSFQMITNIPKMGVSDREELSGAIGYWISVGGKHMIKNQMGMSGLQHLSGDNICFSIDGIICISCIDLSGMEKGIANLGSSEYIRCSSPEILKGEVIEANEKSVVFSLGMIMYSILNQKIAFDGIEAETAGGMIIQGIRPSVEKITTEFPKWVGIIERSWKTERKERPTFREIEKEIEKLTPKVTEGGPKKSKAKKKEGEKKKTKRTKRKRRILNHHHPQHRYQWGILWKHLEQCLHSTRQLWMFETVCHSR